jgi:hypothetical protein
MKRDGDLSDMLLRNVDSLLSGLHDFIFQQVEPEIVNLVADIRSWCSTNCKHVLGMSDSFCLGEFCDLID